MNASAIWANFGGDWSPESGRNSVITAFQSSEISAKNDRPPLANGSPTCGNGEIQCPVHLYCGRKDARTLADESLAVITHFEPGRGLHAGSGLGQVSRVGTKPVRTGGTSACRLAAASQDGLVRLAAGFGIL